MSSTPMKTLGVSYSSLPALHHWQHPPTSSKEVLPDSASSKMSFFVWQCWKRSVYKKVWKHVLCYAMAYVMLTLVYNFVLDEHGKKNFEDLAAYCAKYTGSINLSIMFGFFTTTALKRLFTMQVSLPGTAKTITLFMIFDFQLQQEKGPKIIEQFARWQVLSWILAFRIVCKPLRKMYPDLSSLQKAGLLYEEERIALEQNSTPRALITLDWVLALLRDCMCQDHYFNSSDYLKCVDETMKYKKKCGDVIKFSTQNMPHALIQAVMLGVYFFAMATLLARNFRDRSVDDKVSEMMDYLPIMPTVQFFIYYAWLSFGRAAVNPFGDDADDDINIKRLVENHIQDSLRLQKIYTVPLKDIFSCQVTSELQSIVTSL